jgi:alpha-mannosidase
MLDSILIVRGEQARKFRLGIGADVSHPIPIAWSGLLDPVVVPNVSAPTSSQSSWLFHCDAKNVMVTHLEALVEDGKPVGYRARLQETLGRSANCQLSSFRPASKAQQLDFLGAPLGELTVTDGKVKVEVPGHGMVEVEARFV